MDFGFFSYPTARPDKENLNPARPGKKPRVRQQSDRIAVGRTLLAGFLIYLTGTRHKKYSQKTRLVFPVKLLSVKNLIVTRD